LAAPVYVQTAEVTAASEAQYTVPEWAEIDEARLRLVDGDSRLADGIELLLTPGHTPGHQSVVIEAADRRVVLGAQCAFRGDEIRSGEPAATNLHDESWRNAARESLAHVRRLDPVTVELSHDPTSISL
jgi:glyoxylase-like metal-dependent hydrolase (beta-lactamase superfamily II)